MTERTARYRDDSLADYDKHEGHRKALTRDNANASENSTS
jgi:hypothetical protein